MDRQNVLTERLKRAKLRDRAQQTTPMRSENSNSSPPVSFVQERFWFLNQLEPNNPLHNRAFAWKLTGPFELAIFTQSVSTIIERHEAFRTAILTKNNRPLPTLFRPSPIAIEYADFTQQPKGLQEEIKSIWKRPIPLEAPPLLRVAVFKLADQAHIALFVMHHVTFDALSEGIFKREFVQLYESCLTDSLVSLPKLGFQMHDFARWQRTQLTEKALSSSENFWIDRLAGAPQILSLPTDHPRPTASSFRGGSKTLQLPAELRNAAMRFSQENNVTLYMTLLTTFFILLKRYTGQDDILVATPVSGRSNPETANLIGFFANTLVLRGDTSGEKTFAELLTQIRNTSLQAFEHQDYPIDKLFESLKIEREANIPSLFQVMFNFEQITPPTTIVNGLTIDPFELHLDGAQLDLVVEAQDDGRDLTCNFQFNRDLFEPATIDRMSQHFKVLLENGIDRPDTPIGQLPILTEQEKQLIIYGWNETDLDYDREACIHRVFEQHAVESPDAIAVKQKERFLTYGELNRQANQLARYLIKKGVGPEKLVAVYVERSVKMMIGLLAILKAGGAYVPIDPHLPAARAEFMLKDSEATVVVTQTAWQNRLPSFVESICVDQLPAEVLQEDDSNVDSDVTSQNLVYVIYTSGSTGNPKGVAITHQNLYNYIIGRDHRGIFSRHDRMLQATTLSFDISAAQIFCPLAFGNQITLASPEGFRDIDGVLETMAAEKITVLNGPPSVVEQCLSSPKISLCKDVRYGVSGGEEVTVELVNHFVKKFNAPLINGYGPTEATIGLTTHWCDGTHAHHKVPIGRPSPNCKIYILDEYLNPVPIGVPGEIYLGGEFVGRGYWNRPELTAKKFIPNPFATGKIYRSGDLGRYLSNSNIEFLGRIDHQVKIRGFRIELGEIEAAFLQHPAVQQVKVLAKKINGSDQLIGYIATGQFQSDALSSELHQLVANKLPAYMVPNHIILVEQLPLMLSGKLDLKALPDPKQVNTKPSTPYKQPGAGIEAALAQIWQDVLRIEQVGSNDNFFDLGGHSLLVTRVITRIESQFGIDFPLKTFFESPTIADQALLIEFMTDF